MTRVSHCAAFILIFSATLLAGTAQAYDPMPDPRMAPRDEDTGLSRDYSFERSARNRWLDTQSGNINGRSRRNQEPEHRDGASRDARAWR